MSGELIYSCKRLALFIGIANLAACSCSLLGGDVEGVRRPPSAREPTGRHNSNVLFVYGRDLKPAAVCVPIGAQSILAPVFSALVHSFFATVVAAASVCYFSLAGDLVSASGPCSPQPPLSISTTVPFKRN